MKPPSIPFNKRQTSRRRTQAVDLGVDNVAALLPPQGTRGGNEKMTFLAFFTPFKFHAFSSTFIFERQNASSASRDLHLREMDAFGGAGMEWPQLADGGQEDFVEYHLFSNQALQKQTAGTDARSLLHPHKI
jgi:hypothetical protein